MSKYLIASDRKVNYIDLDEGVLMHWKYIKREKLPSGKWRYYYHDDEHAKAHKEYSDARKQAEIAKETSRSYRQFVTYYQNQLDEKNNGDKRATDADANLKDWKTTQEKAANAHTEAAQKAARLKRKFDKIDKVYQKSAGHKIADLLNKASNAVDKAKDWFKKTFR